MEPLGTTEAWKQKEDLQKECRELLMKSKTVEEFDEIYDRYFKKYKLLIACAILAIDDKMYLKRTILDLAVFMPDAKTRRSQLAEAIEKENKLYEQTLNMGMEMLKEVNDELLSQFIASRKIAT